MVPASASLSFSITVSADKKAVQKVWMNGELVSSQTDTMKGLPLYAYGTNECYTGDGGDCGSMKAYSKLTPPWAPLPALSDHSLVTGLTRIQAWSNVTIELAEADSSFGDTLYDLGTSTKLSTSDSGKTWTGSFTINADDF